MFSIKEKDTPKGLFDSVFDSVWGFKTVIESGQLFYFNKNNGIWRPYGDKLIRAKLRERYLDIPAYLEREVIRFVEDCTFINAKDFGPDYNFITLNKGELDIRDMDYVEGFDASHNNRAKFNINYDPKAWCPNFLRFMREILPDGQDRYTVLEGFASVLIPKMNLEKAFMLIGSGANGKCQIGTDTVLMANGSWKQIKDIQKGDKIISPQLDGSSKISNVTEIHSRFENNVYEIREQTRHKKLLYTCAGNHEIPLIRKWTKRTSKDDSTPRLRERKLFHYEASHISKLNNEKSEYCTFTTTPVQYEQKNCIIEPYCLGVWLGDGHYSKIQTKIQIHRQVSITTADQEIIQIVEQNYPNEITKAYPKPNNQAKSYRFTLKGKFVKGLDVLQLAGKNSGTKFIPKECLLSDVNYRAKLLGGLLDTDGFIDKNGAIWYTTKSKQLAIDVKNLVFSLGGYASIRDIQKSCQIVGFIGNYFEVSIRFETPEILSLIGRKQDRLKSKIRNPRHVAIKAVKTKPQMVYGFEIDSPSHWYVTNEWNVTHNSTLFNVFKDLMDIDSYCAVSIHSLIYNRFIAAELDGRIANIYPDINSTVIKELDRFKMIISSEVMTVERKNGQPFPIKPITKHFFSANQPPEIKEDTDAVFRRFIMIEFPNSFLENENVDLFHELIKEK